MSWEEKLARTEQDLREQAMRALQQAEAKERENQRLRERLVEEERERERINAERQQAMAE